MRSRIKKAWVKLVAFVAALGAVAVSCIASSTESSLVLLEEQNVFGHEAPLLGPEREVLLTELAGALGLGPPSAEASGLSLHTLMIAVGQLNQDDLTEAAILAAIRELSSVAPAVEFSSSFRVAGAVPLLATGAMWPRGNHAGSSPEASAAVAEGVTAARAIVEQVIRPRLIPPAPQSVAASRAVTRANKKDNAWTDYDLATGTCDIVLNPDAVQPAAEWATTGAHELLHCAVMSQAPTGDHTTPPFISEGLVEFAAALIVGESSWVESWLELPSSVNLCEGDGYAAASFWQMALEADSRADAAVEAVELLFALEQQGLLYRDSRSALGALYQRYARERADAWVAPSFNQPDLGSRWSGHDVLPYIRANRQVTELRPNPAVAQSDHAITIKACTAFRWRLLPQADGASAWTVTMPEGTVTNIPGIGDIFGPTTTTFCLGDCSCWDEYMPVGEGAVSIAATPWPEDRSASFHRLDLERCEEEQDSVPRSHSLPSGATVTSTACDGHLAWVLDLPAFLQYIPGPVSRLSGSVRLELEHADLRREPSFVGSYQGLTMTLTEDGDSMTANGTLRGRVRAGVGTPDSPMLASTVDIVVEETSVELAMRMYDGFEFTLPVGSVPFAFERPGQQVYCNGQDMLWASESGVITAWRPA